MPIEASEPAQLERLLDDEATLNAYRLCFDSALLGEIRLSYRQQIAPYFKARPQDLMGGKVLRRRLDAYDLFSYDDYPLLWLSANQASSFEIYHRLYENLELSRHFKPLLDIKQDLQLYCGFLVIGNQSAQTLWHQDYRPEAPAYTLLTPLFDLDPGHGHLLYRDGERERVYPYQLGEACFLGGGVAHSTQPYAASAHLRVLVSLTFGSDRLSAWPLIKQNIQNQSRYYYLPCGHLRGRCWCLQKTSWQRFFKGRDLRDRI